MVRFNEFKNVSVESVEFEKNSVVMILKSENSGGTRLRVLTIPECPGTDPDKIVKHVLKCFVAENKVSDNFVTEFGTFQTGKKINGENETIQTKFVLRPVFRQFLSADVIFKTDANGALSRAIVCDPGLTFKDTALNIRPDQIVTLYSYNSNEFRSALHHTAMAVLKQSSFRSDVENEIKKLNDGLKELSEKEKNKK